MATYCIQAYNCMQRLMHEWLKRLMAWLIYIVGEWIDLSRLKNIVFEIDELLGTCAAKQSND